MGTKLLGDLYLLLAAVVWGACFSAQKQGMEFVGPFTFNFARLVVGVCALAPFMAASAVYKRYKEKQQGVVGESTPLISKDREAQTEVPAVSRWSALIAYSLAGLFMTFASTFQQWGIVSTTAGKAGFLTGDSTINITIPSIIIINISTNTIITINIVINTNNINTIINTINNINTITNINTNNFNVITITTNTQGSTQC
jgi:drug/metabolite transporter (DMT)-like permease